MGVTPATSPCITMVAPEGSVRSWSGTFGASGVVGTSWAGGGGANGVRGDCGGACGCGVEPPPIAAPGTDPDGGGATDSRLDRTKATAPPATATASATSNRTIHARERGGAGAAGTRAVAGTGTTGVGGPAAAGAPLAAASADGVTGTVGAVTAGGGIGAARGAPPWKGNVRSRKCARSAWPKPGETECT